MLKSFKTYPFLSSMDEPNKIHLTEDEERSKADTTTESDSMLERIAGEATRVTTGETRFVLHLNKNDLQSNYLVSGGGKKLIEKMSDDEVKDFLNSHYASGASAADRKSTRIEEIGKVVEKFSKMLQTGPVNKYLDKPDATVIIDVPDSLAAQLKAATPDVTKAREILSKMMNHNYYVMTINNGKAKGEIANKIDTEKDVEELKKVFDPSIVMNYPIKQILTAAKNEWDELNEPTPVGPSDKEDSPTGPTETPTGPTGGAETPTGPTGAAETPTGPAGTPEPPPTPLDHSEMYNQMKGLWDAWSETGLKADDKMMELIRDMWRDLRSKRRTPAPPAA